jgi:hypothetical protein
MEEDITVADGDRYGGKSERNQVGSGACGCGEIPVPASIRQLLILSARLSGAVPFISAPDTYQWKTN